jgi:hypothetical protein
MNLVLKITSLALFTLLTQLPTTAVAQSNNDREAITAVLQNFVGAYVKDDAAVMRKAFRSDGVMIGYSLRAVAKSSLKGSQASLRQTRRNVSVPSRFWISPTTAQSRK